MLLQIKDSRDLVKVVDIEELFDPASEIVHVQEEEREGEEQETDIYPKVELVFPSGEKLPRCWLES